jgi:signal transduction histidine kinase
VDDLRTSASTLPSYERAWRPGRSEAPPTANAAPSFPLRPFAAGVALTLGLFVLAGVFAWRLYAGFREVATTDLELTKLAGEIVHLDEVLTMSARMAAATGDPSWEGRYRRFEPEFDRAIKRAITIAPEAHSVEAASATEAANARLVAIENRALALVRKGERKAAAQALFSEDYEREKRLRADGMASVILALHQRVEHRILGYHQRGWFAVAVGSVLFVLLVACWSQIARLLLDHARARNSAVARLKDAQETLGQRIAERTAELANKNAELTGAYESMRIHQQGIVLTEKMASLGRLTAGIAHEMNSPLAAVRAALSSAGELVAEYADSIGDAGVTPDDHRGIASELRDCIELAEAGAERAIGFVRSMKAQTRNTDGDSRVRFDGVRSIRDALHLLGHAAVAERTKLEVDCALDSAELAGRSGRLEQVVTNLVQNAIDATAERGGGEVRVVIRQEDRGLVLEVIDDGPGIPPDLVTKIFDPLFTTKPIGKGTGLGLTIVHDIVRGEFGGSVDVVSESGRGTTFKVHLPFQKEPNHGA